jgi:hypothetical protein
MGTCYTVMHIYGMRRRYEDDHLDAPFDPDEKRSSDRGNPAFIGRKRIGTEEKKYDPRRQMLLFAISAGL